MEPIKLYLEKFKDWRPAGAEVKAALREIIARRFQTDLKNDDIHLSGPYIYLKTKPILKSEIYIHRGKIVQELEKRLARNTPAQII